MIARRMKGLSGLLFFLVVLSNFSGQTALGWGDVGHSAVGEIAERNLTKQGKAFVYDLLGPEPLAVAAVFPDLVRSDARFKAFAPYHYIEIPHEVVKAQDLKDTDRKKRDVHVMLDQVPRILIDRDSPKERKAFLFRFLVHLVGDVHQPLHIGNGGDMGANLCDVLWRDPSTGVVRREDLHGVWDERIFDYTRHDFANGLGKAPNERYFTYQTLVRSVLADTSQESKDAAAELQGKERPDVREWYQQARSYHPKAYPDQAKYNHPRERPYCKRVAAKGGVVNGAYDKEALPAVEEPFVRDALRIAKLQILRAGYRLAQLINWMAAQVPERPPIDESQLRFFLSVTLENARGIGAPVRPVLPPPE